MPTINFIHPDNNSLFIEANDGDSVMLTAMIHAVDGIVGECGGCTACGTCHVYVDGGWVGRLPAVDSNEDEMLDSVAAQRLPNSRLSCQIRITSELDGLILYLPERQV
jgi:ferredoxin, 2Fe-2S